MITVLINWRSRSPKAFMDPWKDPPFASLFLGISEPEQQGPTVHCLCSEWKLLQQELEEAGADAHCTFVQWAQVLLGPESKATIQGRTVIALRRYQDQTLLLQWASERVKKGWEWQFCNPPKPRQFDAHSAHGNHPVGPIGWVKDEGWDF